MDFILTQREFRERLKETSPKIVDLMSSEEAENVLEAISREYQIEPAKARRLAFYVAHVFLGVLPPKEFKSAIEKDLGFGSENALHIAEEIDHKLFRKVRKELHDTYGAKTFTKEPTPHRPVSQSPTTHPLSPQPLDLRMRSKTPEAPLSPEEEFPGEIINGNPENTSEISPRVTPEPQKAFPPKPGLSPRPAPRERDSYREPIENEGPPAKPKPLRQGEGPRPIQERSVINLKNR